MDTALLLLLIAARTAACEPPDRAASTQPAPGLGPQAWSILRSALRLALCPGASWRPALPATLAVRHMGRLRARSGWLQAMRELGLVAPNGRS